MTTTEHTATTVFDAVVAAWDREPTCEVLDETGAHLCGRPAAWRWRFHECSQGIMCNHHLRKWRDEMSEVVFPERCMTCGTVFHRLDDVCTVTPL